MFKASQIFGKQSIKLFLHPPSAYSAHLNIGLLGDRFLNGKSSQNHFANNEYHHSEVVVGSLKGQSCPDVEWFGFQTML